MSNYLVPQAGTILFTTVKLRYTFDGQTIHQSSKVVLIQMDEKFDTKPYSEVVAMVKAGIAEDSFVERIIKENKSVHAGIAKHISEVTNNRILSVEDAILSHRLQVEVVQVSMESANNFFKMVND